ncbi:hypothetical protein HanIR_Chr15g0763441 [Helianthus annuus]|nr:hypothetical protein HanIR_Chr15g0763441 [Helianthus annuus]
MLFFSPLFPLFCDRVRFSNLFDSKSNNIRTQIKKIVYDNSCLEQREKRNLGGISVS